MIQVNICIVVGFLNKYYMMWRKQKMCSKGGLIKRCFVLIGIIFLLVGCGKVEESVVEDEITDELIYVSKFVPTPIAKKYGALSELFVLDNEWYYRSPEFLDTDQVKQNYMKVDLDNVHQQEMIVEDNLDNGNTATAFPALDGSIYYLKYQIVDGETKWFIEKRKGQETVSLHELDNIFTNVKESDDISKGFTAPDELLYFITSENKVYAVGEDGKLVQQYNLPKDIEVKLVSDGSGNVYSVYRENQVLSIYSLENMNKPYYQIPFEQGHKIPGVISGSGETLYYWNEKGIYPIDLTTVSSQEEPEIAFEWGSEYINILWNYILGIKQTGDNEFLITAVQDKNIDAIYISQKKKSEVPKKQNITIAKTFDEMDPLYFYIQDFNRYNQEYSITVKVYDWVGKDEVLSDIQLFDDLSRSGDIDLIDLGNYSTEDFVDNGILEELTPYFESSTVMKREDISDFIWNSWLIDSKMYYIYPQYNITANAVKVDTDKWKDGYSLEDVYNFKKQYPDIDILNTTPFGTIDFFIRSNLDAYVNWEEKTCRFMDSDFIDFIAFIGTWDFKEEAGSAANVDDYSASVMAEYERFRNVEYLFHPQILWCMADLCNGYTYFGDDIQWVGYPNQERQVVTRLFSKSTIGINGNSDNKEGAWKFIEYVLSEESQYKIIDKPYPLCFPVREKVMLEYLQRPYASAVPGSTFVSNNDTKIATQEQIDVMLSLMKNSRRYATQSDVEFYILTIIVEEMEEFLNYGKTPEGTAEIIQSRVHLYLNEQ